MNGKQFAFVVVAVGSLFVVEAKAQSFFQRLTEQLNQQPNQPNPPAASNNTLPPPRELAPNNGATRASLGIRVGPVTEELQREQRLVVRRGAVINGIEAGSAADQAGLPLGSVIVAFAGRRIDTPEDLVDAVRRARPESDVELTYYDREKLARKMVHLAAVPAQEGAIPNEPSAPFNPPSPVHNAVPSAGASNLERQLGAAGSRPLLGRLGRAIDNFASQAQAVAPVEPAAPVTRSDLGVEVQELRLQIATLTKELDELRKHVTSLEKKLAEKAN